MYDIFNMRKRVHIYVRIASDRIKEVCDERAEDDRYQSVELV